MKKLYFTIAFNVRLELMPKDFFFFFSPEAMSIPSYPASFVHYGPIFPKQCFEHQILLQVVHTFIK
jgi:hypothetical protein